MYLVYETTILEIGSNASDFFEHSMFIIFKGNAPQELKDYCFLHEENAFHENIQKGYRLFIDEEAYEITSVGNLVNKNLKELGHITFKFSGETNAEISGTLYLENKPIKSITVGSILRIIK